MSGRKSPNSPGFPVSTGGITVNERDHESITTLRVDGDETMPRVQERDGLAHDLTVPWVLPSGPSSVTLARRAARQQLDDLGIKSPEVLDTVELLVSELTANVVKHVGGRASLRVIRIGDVIRIEVCDANPDQTPVERDVDVDSMTGRGLLLVSTLATAWGFDRDDDQKCTWAEIDLATFSPSGLTR